MRITKSEMKYIRSLRNRKTRESERKFIVEGWKSIRDALRTSRRIVLAAAAGESLEDPDHSDVLGELRVRQIQLKQLSGIELKQVSDTVHSQGIIAVVEQKNFTLDEILERPVQLLVLADRIADPGNLGTMIRTCDWFGVDALLMSVECVDAYNEKVVRSTSGSIFHVPLVNSVKTNESILKLRHRGFKVFATSGGGESSFQRVGYGEKNLVIFGNEGSGIPGETQSLADDVICIPGRGKAESLNVGVACGIILSHLRG